MSEAAAQTPSPATSRRFTDATPAQVRAALTPESAGEFDRQWRAVLARAAESLDLAELFHTLTGWRQVAELTASLGYEGYREFEAQTQRRIAMRQAQGATPTIHVSVADVNAQVKARLDRAR